MTDNFPKELARMFIDASTSIARSRNPVGWWVIGDGFHVALYKKPTAEHIKNHQEMLGWKWRDAE